MPPVKSHTPALEKGRACATCKARKVKCDAVFPACGACVRTARFEGRSVDDLCCTYGVSRRTGGRKSRSKAAIERKESTSSQSSSPEPCTSAQASATTSFASQALPASTLANTYSPPPPLRPVAPVIAPLPSTLPPLPSLPPYQFPVNYDFGYTPSLVVTSSTPSNELADLWTASDFSSSPGASLGVIDPFPWSFEDALSTSPTSSYASSYWDDHIASPESLHSTSDFSSCHSPDPYTADELALSFFGSSKQDETLSLPLFPLVLPSGIQEAQPWFGAWEQPSGFTNWSAMA